MRKEITFKLYTIMVALLLITASAINATSFAWYKAPTTEVKDTTLTGEILSQYFYSGDGSAEHPFEITTPEHYYNLVHLYQEVSDFSDQGFYFALGTNYGTAENPNYGFSSGTDKDLSLSCYSSTGLLPIGTHDKSFMGTFDGRGLEITDLRVVGRDSKECDIGIFGYVSSSASITNVYFSNVTIDLSNITNVVSSVVAPQDHNESPHTESGKSVAYAGYLAGHIVTTSQFTNVYINDTTITGLNSSTIGYGYFGCVENEDGTTTSSLGEAIITEYGDSGDDAGWGNTVDMKNLYNRLNEIAGSVYSTSTLDYPKVETVVMYSNGKVISRTVDETSNSTATHSGKSLSFRHYSSNKGGSYYFNVSNGYSPYIYLTGLNQFQTKTVYTSIIETGTSPAKYFCNGTASQYLGVSNDFQVVAAKAQSDAAKWQFSSGTSSCVKNYVYTNIGTTTYYLGRNGNSVVLSTTTASACTWTLNTNSDGSTEFYTISNENGVDVPYFLIYDSVWQLVSEGLTYVISDNNNHYIGISNDQITTEVKEGAAAEWYINTENSKAVFQHGISGSALYLAMNSTEGLCLSSSVFEWDVVATTSESVTSPGTIDTFYSYCTTDTEGRTWYIDYDSGWKVVVTEGVNIYSIVSEGGVYVNKYLTAAGGLNGFTTGDATDYFSLWDMNLNGSPTSIALNYNGKSYYLGADTIHDSLTLSTNPTTWIYDSESSTYHPEGMNKYMAYKDGVWCLQTSSEYRIRYDVNNLVVVSSNSSIYLDNCLTTDLGSYDSQYNTWIFQNIDGEGAVYATIDGHNYYLCVSGTALTLVAESVFRKNDDGSVASYKFDADEATKWRVNSFGIYTEINNYNYYINYSNAQWGLVNMHVTIHNYDWYLTHSSDKTSQTATKYASVSTAETTKPDEVFWEIDDHYIWLVLDDGTKMYLACQGINMAPILQTDPYSWTIKQGSDAENGYLGYTIKTSYNKIPLRLVNQGSVWYTLPEDTYHITALVSGTTHALNITGNTVGDTIYQTAITSHWQITPGENTFMFSQYSTSDGSVSIYLAGDGDGVLYITTNSALGTEWSFDTTLGGYYYNYVNTTSEGSVTVKYMLIYDSDTGKWCAENLTSIPNYYVKSGSNYLQLGLTNGRPNEVIGNTSSTGNPTAFYVAASAANSTIMYKYDDGSTLTGESYYLAWNTDSQSLYISNQEFTWLYDGTEKAFYVDEGGVKKYLTYDDSLTGLGWTCLSKKRMFISFASDTLTIYLAMSGSSIVYSETPFAWDYDGTGTASPNHIFANYAGTNYYLSCSSNKLTLSNSASNTWAYHSTYLSYYPSNSSDYYICFNGSSWTLLRPGTEKYYFVSDGSGNYLGSSTVATTIYTAGLWPAYVGTHTMKNSAGVTMRWNKFDYSELYFHSDVWDYNWVISADGTIKENGRKYYLGISGTTWTTVTDVDDAYLTIKSIYNIDIVDYQCVKSELETVNSPKKYGKMSAWEYPETFIAQDPKSGYAVYAYFPASVDPLHYVMNKIRSLPLINTDLRNKQYFVRTVDTNAEQIASTTSKSGVWSGFATYIPIRLMLQDDTDSTSYYSDYRVDSRNTGYIVSGAHESTSSYMSDIRVSSYDTSDIYKSLNSDGRTVTYNTSYDSKLQVLTRTTSSAGFTVISDSINEISSSDVYSEMASGVTSSDKCMTPDQLGLTKYMVYDSDGNLNTTASTRKAFASMLSGDSDVYGMHFMNASISTGSVIYADQVTIMGNTYYNYQLPEDCIDFDVVERGVITFYAGTYYSYDVDCFFSLHHITRDSNETITSIREIKKIYKPKSGLGAYVYQYGDSIDGSNMSNGDYCAGDYSESNSKYTLAFDMEWITSPSTIIQNAVYYFELPVNRGEYALGSVENHTGAYLLYLDIATKGGDNFEVESNPEGTGVIPEFTVEYRSYDDKINTRSLMQFAITTPNKTENGESFSVNVEFNRSSSNATTGGIYTITVTNLSSTDLEMIVYMCDDDDNEYNSYDYTYEILYINKDHPNATPLKSGDIQYFKTCQGYSIPDTGVAGLL